jgi:hypothetical protein
MQGDLNEIKLQDISLTKVPAKKPVLEIGSASKPVVDIGSNSSGSQSGTARPTLRKARKRLPDKFADKVM